MALAACSCIFMVQLQSLSSFSSDSVVVAHGQLNSSALIQVHQCCIENIQSFFLPASLQLLSEYYILLVHSNPQNKLI